MRNGSASREVGHVEVFRFVGNESDTLHALGAYRVSNSLHGEGSVNRLAARHGNRVVEQDLVGDVGIGSQCLADGQRPRVIVSAVAQVLENVPATVEHRARNPVDAFAAHLDEAVRVAPHPACHEMAADAGQCPRSFRHPC